MKNNFLKRIWSFLNPSNEITTVKQAEREISAALRSGNSINLKMKLSHNDLNYLAIKFSSIKLHLFSSCHISINTSYREYIIDLPVKSITENQDTLQLEIENQSLLENQIQNILKKNLYVTKVSFQGNEYDFIMYLKGLQLYKQYKITDLTKYLDDNLKVKPISSNLPNYIAIDFETANSERSSACSLGIVVVRDGLITDRLHYYINPGDIEWNHRNISIHGIRPQDVLNAPVFPKIWQEVKHLFTDYLVVAHNASSFDLSVLRAVLSEYDLEIPPIKFTCTLDTAKRLGLETKLDLLCDKLGIPLQHHDALSDAEACAQIVTEISTLYDFDNTFIIKTINTENSIPSLARPRKNVITRETFENTFRLIKLSSDEKEVNYPPNYFKDKRIVISGVYTNYPDRTVLKTILEQNGAIVTSAISGKTNVFLIGMDAGPSKLQKVLELQGKGIDIEIINEHSLMRILK